MVTWDDGNVGIKNGAWNELKSDIMFGLLPISPANAATGR